MSLRPNGGTIQPGDRLEVEGCGNGEDTGLKQHEHFQTVSFSLQTKRYKTVDLIIFIHTPCRLQPVTVILDSPATMARSLSQTLALTLTRLSHPSLHRSSSQLLAFRCRSNRPENRFLTENGFLTELDLEASDPDLEILRILKLDDAIDQIHVRRRRRIGCRSFPGRRFGCRLGGGFSGLADLVGKLAYVLSEDEAMSLTTVRGWPSSSYFVNGE
ncbi:hypothetical protein CK203_023026 [Vitis vinifera]|uniref:Uncharacterized protein n=1 Tax=Vitis vinifera TaxID=29760 RepID=A0A438J3V3_VITVI|nr:hypothetical protein CK203_023026 [Vitis vinifera]